MEEEGRKWSPVLILVMVIVYLAVLGTTLSVTGVIQPKELWEPVGKVAGNIGKLFKRKPAPKTAEEESSSEDVVDFTPTVSGSMDMLTESAGLTTPSTPVSTATPTVSADRKRGNQKLAKMYGSMDPEAAAQIFINLEDREIIEIFKEMKEQAAADILAAMTPTRAASITVDMQVP